MTQAIQRHTRRSPFGLRPPRPDAAWVNDEEFEILESGIFADETVGLNWSHRPARH